MLQRRRSYAAPLWSADYFVLRHIRSFAIGRIESLSVRDRVVLDAGCGEQPLRELVEAGGARYVGLDVEQNRAATVDVIAPLWETTLAAGSIHVVLATEVLEHVADTGGAFREMARILASDGAIVITTPFAYPLHELPHDYVRLTAGAIAWHADQYGLRVREIHALGDEVEVLAVTFCNLMSNILAELPFALRVAAATLRLPLNVLVNVGALVVRSILAPVLPRRSYLTTAAVLTR